MPPKPALGGVLAVAAALALAGCGGGADPAAAGTTAAAPAPASSTADTDTAGPVGSVSPVGPTATTAPATATTTAAPGRPATPRRTPGPTRPPRPPVPEPTRALCEVQQPAIAGLLGGATGDRRYEALRDAIPELTLRITALAGAGVAPAVVATLRGLYADWVAALQAYDDGDRAAATRALAAADTALARAGAQARQALPPGAHCD